MPSSVFNRMLASLQDIDRVFHKDRWCRSYLAQSPANGCDAVGIFNPAKLELI